MVKGKGSLNLYCLGEDLDYPIYLRMTDRELPKDVLNKILDFGFEVAKRKILKN